MHGYLFAEGTVCHNLTKSLPIALLYDLNLLAKFNVRRFSGRDVLKVTQEEGLVSSEFFHFAIEIFNCQFFIPEKGMAKWTLMSHTPTLIRP